MISHYGNLLARLWAWFSGFFLCAIVTNAIEGRPILGLVILFIASTASSFNPAFRYPLLRSERN